MAEPPAPAGRAWPGLVAALLSAALLPLNSTMISVALPDIALHFDRPAGAVTQLLVGIYLIAAIVLQSPGGKLGDRLGHRRMFALGQVMTALGALLGFAAPTLGLLVVSRVLVAAGGAAIVPATVALLRSELPAERRGRGFGMFAAVMSLAAGIGPVVGGELVTWFGWPSIFLVNLPVLAVSAALGVSVRLFAAPVDATARPRFDWVGTVLLAAVLSTFVLGLEGGGTTSVLLLTLAAVLVVPFVWWERRTGDPVVAFALFGYRAFTAGTVLIAMQNLAMYTLVFELPQVLRALLAVDAATAGRLLVAMMAATVVTSVVAGGLVDRLGPRVAAVTGSLACLVSLAVLATSDLTAPGQALAPLVLFGLGIGLATPAAQSASLGVVDRRESGMAAGVNSTMRYLGGVVGVAILGRSLDLAGDRAHILGEHRAMLAVFGGALLIGLACAVTLPGRSIRSAPADVA